jgi:hypothetical protein
MRPKLRTITEQRLHPRESARRRLAGAARSRAAAHPPASAGVERERHCGGPLDRASYACSCGYVWQADVGTDISCPHCHVDQAW